MIDTPSTTEHNRQALNAAAPDNPPTLAQLVSGIADDAQRLIQQQYQMLRAEVKEDMRRSKAAVQYLGVGAGLAVLGAVFLLVALPLLVNWAFSWPDWAGWALIGAVLAVVGSVALYAGKRVFDKNNPLPDKTLNALEENISWIANRQK
jgi:uncharacterized membrane protein YqjE